MFEQVGGFDERLEACEDVQLCQKVRQAGYRIVSEPGMDNVHHGDPRALTDLFFGELWRGRNNLHVSLQGPLTVRALPSVVLPIVGLSCLACSDSACWRGRGWAALTAMLGAVGLAGVVSESTGDRRARAAGQSCGVGSGLVVAATYETARALSLVSSATHRTRTRVARHA